MIRRSFRVAGLSNALFQQDSTLRLVIFLGLLSGGSLGLFLVLSFLEYQLGFPLDDAWIHQVYARNLADNGEWAFIPGSPSGGSTAPLWSLFLSLGYFLRTGPLIWTYALGWLSLTALGLIAYFGAQRNLSRRSGWAIWIAILIIFEWHLVWAAGSGMETLFYAVFITFIVVWVASGWTQYLIVGLLVGLSVWIRPDGITLLLPVALAVALTTTNWRIRLKHLGLLSVGFIVLFVPYLWFNRLFAGEVWPSTFYAKQAEYALLADIPIWRRMVGELQLPLVGVGLVLLPGFVFYIGDMIRQRKWVANVFVLWWFGFIGLYAWRLPVTYQHGRYLIPIMPVYFFWGMTGLVKLIQPNSGSLWVRLTSRVWLILVPVVLLSFWWLGGQAYARDVAFIETEMVVVAQWINMATPPDAVVAVHDIGAIGYFAKRQILDLAGLVSPEVIPFIRDEVALARYLDEKAADYLVTFPGWYPHLVSLAEPVFRTGGQYGPALGGENLVVYRWTPD